MGNSSPVLNDDVGGGLCGRAASGLSHWATTVEHLIAYEFATDFLAKRLAHYGRAMYRFRAQRAGPPTWTQAHPPHAPRSKRPAPPTLRRHAALHRTRLRLRLHLERRSRSARRSASVIQRASRSNASSIVGCRISVNWNSQRPSARPADDVQRQVKLSCAGRLRRDPVVEHAEVVLAGASGCARLPSAVSKCASARRRA